MYNLFMFYILLVISFIVLGIYLKSAKVRGKRGERSVSRRLDWLPSDEYVTLDDLMLSSNGRTTQIDHVVVSIYGIFVIETKNYKGIITGGENTDTWTQHLYQSKNSLANPIRQNKGHIAAIRRIVHNIYTDEIFSIIAFSGASTLRVSSESADVVYFRELRRCIRRYNKQRMSKDQMAQIVAILSDANVEDKDMRKQHVSQVRQHMRDRELQIANLTCPQCGGTLVRREGSYGRFYGCSNYPKCKFTTK